MGHAARAFLPFERCSFLGLRPALFRPPGILPPAGNFLLAQKVPQKRLPPVALRGLRLTCAPLGASLSCAHQRGSRDTVQKLGACQQCRLKPPRNIRLTCNPPGAIRNSLEKHPSLATLLGLSSAAPISEGRGTLCKMESVSTALCIQPRVFDTRLSNTHMPTLHYLMSIHRLTESNAN